MTHTLHRLGDRESLRRDYVVLTMASQNFNSVGSASKLAEAFQVIVSHNPENAADDYRGGVLTGVTIDEIVSKATEKAYMSGVYTDEEVLERVLRDLKKADLGMSVVVSGDFEMVFRVLNRVGLKPHTVNLSLGIFGNKDLLPTDSVLEITSMCGHGMICPAHVQSIIKKIRAGRMTPADASRDLAKACTCGVFNPSRAETLLERAARQDLEFGDPWGSKQGDDCHDR